MVVQIVYRPHGEAVRDARIEKEGSARHGRYLVDTMKESPQPGRDENQMEDLMGVRFALGRLNRWKAEASVNRSNPAAKEPADDRWGIVKTT